MPSVNEDKIRLGVNIDHVATLRRVRGGTTSYPDIIAIADIVAASGADQITVHLREDRRHIQDEDVERLLKWRKLPINLEMAATSEMIEKALNWRPDWVCLVPEKREELTTEGGLDLSKVFDELNDFFGESRSAEIKTSVFIEPSIEQLDHAIRLKADAAEFHTGKWVLPEFRKSQWEKLTSAAEYAHKNSIAVHAGHGLDYSTTKEICTLPHLRELNIGHSIVCYAIEEGIGQVVKKMAAILNP